MLKIIYSLVGKVSFFYYFFAYGLKKNKNKFVFFKLQGLCNNTFIASESAFIKSALLLSGNDNFFSAKKTIVENSSISLTGIKNKVYLDEGVILRKSTIIVRGNNCSVKIGSNSTFAGVRMVVVGKNCSITIGEKCLFSDFIEIWASDTHSIFNERLEKINQEKSITIGNHVWIGSRAIILKGVTIGDDSVVGMGALVTKNIPKKVVSAGVPNRIVKENITWSIDY